MGGFGTARSQNLDANSHVEAKAKSHLQPATSHRHDAGTTCAVHESIQRLFLESPGSICVSLHSSPLQETYGVRGRALALLLPTEHADSSRQAGCGGDISRQFTRVIEEDWQEVKTRSHSGVDTHRSKWVIGHLGGSLAHGRRRNQSQTCLAASSGDFDFTTHNEDRVCKTDQATQELAWLLGLLLGLCERRKSQLTRDMQHLSTQCLMYSCAAILVPNAFKSSSDPRGQNESHET